MIVKICGMTEQPVITLAARLGADMCGFIFHEPSVRNIEAAQAAALDTHGMERVGVFVQQNADEIRRIVRLARLDRIQLHGGQSAAFAAEFPPQAIIRVLWPNRYDSPEALQADIDAFSTTCGLYLLDAGMGSGQTLDWTALTGLRFPHPWMLSGGLGPENVREALSVCSPSGLDLNSRLESGPGRKSPDLIEKFFRSLAEAAPQRKSL